METGTVGTFCRYHVKAGRAEEFAGLIAQHWPALARLGLVGGEPAQVLRCQDGDETYFVEIFSWLDPGAPARAAASPVVEEVLRPMAELTDEVEVATAVPVAMGPWMVGEELGLLEGAFPGLDGLR